MMLEQINRRLSKLQQESKKAETPGKTVGVKLPVATHARAVKAIETGGVTEKSLKALVLAAVEEYLSRRRL